MSTIVQKYGGSSVATAEHIQRVAARVVKTRRAGHQVVVVVSAMGDSTDELLRLAHSVSPNPQRRELDMLLSVGERISISLLSMAIHDLGCPCVSFTGSQSGIITTDNHTNARIVRVTPVRIRSALDAGRIVIVAGFQGVSERLEITTLGRGGTDTTAVALAAALDADYAEICSDVDGVYTADPRIAPAAQKLETVSYAEMQTLADAGAKVLNAEAVEWARRNNIEIRCAQTHGGTAPGTRIRAAEGLKRQRVVGITAHPGLLVIRGATEPPELRTLLSDHGVADALIWRLEGAVTAMIPRQNLHSAAALTAAIGALPGLEIRDDLTWVTVAGRALLSPPGIAQKARLVLEREGVPALGELLDPGRITFLVEAQRAAPLVRALHETLLEGTSPDDAPVAGTRATASSEEGP